MNLRTARVQGKLGLHGKTLPTKQNTPQTKTRSKGPKEHQGGRELCHAVAMEVEDAGRKFFFRARVRDQVLSSVWYQGPGL